MHTLSANAVTGNLHICYSVELVEFDIRLSNRMHEKCSVPEKTHVSVVYLGTASKVVLNDAAADCERLPVSCKLPSTNVFFQIGEA